MGTTRTSAARLGLQTGYERNSLAHQSIATHTCLHEALDVATGQQFHGLLANGQSHLQYLSAIQFAIFICGGQQCPQLQAQTFTQVTRTDADRFQAVKQAQCHSEVVHQFVELLFVGRVQTLG
jgi:hypothetical protein